MDRRRADGEVRPVDPRGASALDEDRDLERVLARTLVGFARTLDARRDVDADRRRRADCRGDGRGREAAGEEDRDLAGDRRGKRRCGTGAGAAGMGPAGRVEEQPRSARREERASELDDRGGRRRDLARFDRRQVEDLPGGPTDRSDRSPATRCPKAARRPGRGRRRSRRWSLCRGPP